MKFFMALLAVLMTNAVHAQEETKTDEILHYNPDLETRYNPANGNTEIVRRGTSDVVYENIRELNENPYVVVDRSLVDGRYRAIDRRTNEQVSSPRRKKNRSND